MRLQKYMAHSGVASRRKSEEMIAQGKVKVNGKIIREQGYIVERGDVVEVNGKKIEPESQMVYVMLNKPRGVLSTASDEKNRKTVLDCIDEFKDLRLYPVGRLDRDTSGLILLTNDGEFTQKMLHPKFELEKTYYATVEGNVRKEELRPLIEGIELEDGITAPGKFRIVGKRSAKTRIECKIREGRNRQIRRMFEAIGHPVVSLERTQFGTLKLGRLGKGSYRELTEKEVEALRNSL